MAFFASCTGIRGRKLLPDIRPDTGYCKKNPLKYGYLAEYEAGFSQMEARYFQYKEKAFFPGKCKQFSWKEFISCPVKPNQYCTVAGHIIISIC